MKGGGRPIVVKQLMSAWAEGERACASSPSPQSLTYCQGKCNLETVFNISAYVFLITMQIKFAKKEYDTRYVSSLF